MYRRKSGIVFGFHVTTAEIARKLVEDPGSEFKPSRNGYDWLGDGMYFWEGSVHRAERFGKDRQIPNSVVIGAALDLGYCLDLMDSESLAYLGMSYRALKDILQAISKPLPRNVAPLTGNRPDLLVRRLDCAVINFIHAQRDSANERPFDSVRGVFWEGNDLYPDAGFKDQNHIQICICNPNCIKGLFYPRKETDFPFQGVIPAPS